MTTPAATINPVTYQNIGVQSGFLIVSAGSGDTVNIYNGDITNTLLVSPNSTPSLSNSLPIQPLTNATIDGSRAQYASALSGTCSQVSVGAAAQLSPSPAQIAEQINALGLAKDTSVNAPAYGPVPVSYGPSKDSSVQATTTALVTGIALPTGAAKDVTVGALNPGIPNAIATTGVPLLANNTLVKNQAAISQNPGVSSQSATFNMPLPGYEFILTIYATGNFLSFYNLQLSWFDSTSGLQVGEDNFWFVPGTAVGSPHTIVGRGRTKGNQLVVTSAVPSTSSVAVTHTYVVLNNSNIYASDKWETLVFNAAGVTGTSGDVPGKVIASTNISVPAGQNLTRMLPFYTGTVIVVCSTTSGTTDGDLSIIQFSNFTSGANLPNETVYHQKTDTHGLINSSFALPRSQCQAVFTNNNAAAETWGLSLIAAIQEVE